jgi:hypothetical protein
MGTTMFKQLPKSYCNYFYGVYSAEQWETLNDIKLNLTKNERKNFSKFCLVKNILLSNTCSIDHISLDDLVKINILDKKDIQRRKFLAIIRNPIDRVISICNHQNKNIEQVLSEAKNTKIKQIDALHTSFNLNLTLINMNNKVDINNFFSTFNLNIKDIVIQPTRINKRYAINSITDKQKQSISNIFKEDFILYNSCLSKSLNISNIQQII